MDIVKSPQLGEWEKIDNKIHMRVPIRFELQKDEGVWIEGLSLDEVRVPSSHVKNLDFDAAVRIFAKEKGSRRADMDLVELHSDPLPLRPGPTGGNTLVFQVIISEYDFEDFVDTNGFLCFTITFNNNTHVPIRVEVIPNRIGTTVRVKKIRRLHYPVIGLVNSVWLFSIAGAALAFNLSSSSIFQPDPILRSEVVTAILASILSFFGLSFKRIAGFLSNIESIRFFTFYPELNIGRRSFSAFNSLFFSGCLLLVTGFCALAAWSYSPIRLPDLGECIYCKYVHKKKNVIAQPFVFLDDIREGDITVACAREVSEAGGELDNMDILAKLVIDDSARSSVVSSANWLSITGLPKASVDWVPIELRLTQKLGDGSSIAKGEFPVSPSDLSLKKEVRDILGEGLSQGLREQMLKELCRENRKDPTRLTIGHNPGDDGGHIFDVTYYETQPSEVFSDEFEQKVRKGRRAEINQAILEKDQSVHVCRLEGLAKRAHEEINPENLPLGKDAFLENYSALVKDISEARRENMENVIALHILVQIFIDKKMEPRLDANDYREIYNRYVENARIRSGTMDVDVTLRFWEVLVAIETALGSDVEGHVHQAIQGTIEEVNQRRPDTGRELVVGYLDILGRYRPMQRVATDKRRTFFSAFQSKILDQVSPEQSMLSWAFGEYVSAGHSTKPVREESDGFQILDQTDLAQPGRQ